MGAETAENLFLGSGCRRKGFFAKVSYGQKILTDKEALINLFYSPDLHGTGTNAKYRWLPAWRREFGKYAEKMLTGEQLEIINKRLFFSEW